MSTRDRIGFFHGIDCGEPALDVGTGGSNGRGDSPRDCVLQCQCDRCLNGHTTPLSGPRPAKAARSDVRRLRGTTKTAVDLRKEARAIQVAGQQYKRRAERRAARFYDAAHRIDGKGRLRDTRGGRKRLESFDPTPAPDMVLDAAQALTARELDALERRAS